MPKIILFVCTGNTCRSVMAKGLIKKMLPKIKVFSAGTGAFPLAKAIPETVAVMKEEGIDVSSHRATVLTIRRIKEADLILVMDLTQKEKILTMEPQAKEKVFLLKEFAEEKDRQKMNIPDPIAQPLEVYRVCRDEIKSALQKVAEKISP